MGYGICCSIREYHQNIAQAVAVNQLLGDYYDSYKSLLDKVYHPIKTLDSLTQYRQPILAWSSYAETFVH